MVVGAVRAALEFHPRLQRALEGQDETEPWEHGVSRRGLAEGSDTAKR